MTEGTSLAVDSKFGDSFSEGVRPKLGGCVKANLVGTGAAGAAGGKGRRQ